MEAVGMVMTSLGRMGLGETLIDDAEFFGKLLRVKRRAVENPPVQFKGWDFIPPAIGAPHKVRGIVVLFNIDLFKRDLANLQKLLGAATVGAKARGVHAECGVHF
jgi:hypothetical protein